MFPGVELPEPDYGKFQEIIVDVMIEQKLKAEKPMVKKVIQLYETMIVRWGVMLVGPTGGGKSTVLNVNCNLFFSMISIYICCRLSIKL